MLEEDDAPAAAPPEAATQPALPRGSILFRNVAKQYTRRQRETPRLGAWVVDKLFEHFTSEPFWALEEVSFRIDPGEMVAIVGNNGAGKSTTLKLIAGITEPTRGSVARAGRVASLLELGVGFHPELSGLENIFYNGALLGLTRDEVHRKLATIIDFSGLRDHIYGEVRHYSTGMYSRLACSVALHLEPDIILIDEILAVGDAEFQQRGMMKMLELHERGATVILVTHELATAAAICDRFLWIEGGRVRRDAPSRDVYIEYLRETAERSLPHGHPFHPARASEGTPATLLLNGAPPPFSLARGDRAEFRIVPGDAAPGRARLHIHARWYDGRTLFEDVSEPAETARLRYVIAPWEFGRFDGTIGAAVVDEAGAILARTPLHPLHSTTPGILQDEYLQVPHPRVVITPRREP